MKRQIELFFTSLMFYTRIPIPKCIKSRHEELNCATRFYPLVGCIIGALSFVVFWAANYLFSPEISAILTLGAGVLLTGAFHEDGFADTFDGFGGGYTKEKILEIMKDSRIGTYGTMALILQMALKIFALASFAGEPPAVLALLFVMYHSLARLTSGNVVFWSKYARADATSKVKPVEKGATKIEILIAYIIGFTPLSVLAYSVPGLWGVLIPLALLFWLAKRYFEKHIGGYTGDCLGFTEQASELVILLYTVALWKFM